MRLATPSLVLSSFTSLLVSAADLGTLEDRVPSCAVPCYADYLESRFGDPDAWKQGCSLSHSYQFAYHFSRCAFAACGSVDFNRANNVLLTICSDEDLGAVTGSGNGDDSSDGGDSDSSNHHNDGAGMLYNKAILPAAVAVSGATIIFGLLA